MASVLIEIDATQSKSYQDVKSFIEKMQTNPPTIKIKVDGLQGFTKGTEEAVKALTRLTSVQAKLAQEERKIVESNNEVRIQQQKTRQEYEKTRQKALEMLRSYSTEAVKAEGKVRSEAEKTSRERIKSETKIQQEQERTARTHENNATRQAVSQNKVTVAQEKTTQEILKTERAMQQTENRSKSLFSSFLAYRVVRQIIYEIGSAFKEALDVMKAVDSELVTVRKVTGASGERIEEIRQSAYASASKYGESAAGYLEAVASFARAGYGDLSESLADLAIKTKIVGDTDQETATQFLLSMDAAYKYQGQVEKLTAVLDGANEIDNKYATSIQKIAEGLGIVAPVAAQMNVTEQELTAAIGTITAVTQRSGTEAARALRALFLNIMGDINTEIEDGETATEESISSLRGLLKKYASDAWEAAKATGSIIDPMEAIAALSKAMKDGLLTEQELMSELSALGGKLRTTQLVALVENFDGMYTNMLNTYATAVGSADKEVSNALDSWERKSEILKNTWTEFVSKTVTTDWIKGALDGLTNILKVVGSLGNAIAIVAAVVVALNLPRIITFLSGIGTGIVNIISGIAELVSLYREYKSLGGTEGFFQFAGGTPMTAVQIAILAATAAIVALTTAYQAYIKGLEEASTAMQEQSEASLKEYQNMDALRQQYEEAETAYKNGTITKEEYEAVTQRVAAALGLEATQAENLRTELERLTEQERAQALKDAQLAQQAIAAEIAGKNGKLNTNIDAPLRRAGFFEATTTEGKIEAARKAEEELQRTQEELSKKIVEGTASWGEQALEYKRNAEALKWLTEQLDEYERQEEILAILNGEAIETTNDEAESFNDLADNIVKAKDALDDFTTATQEELDDTFQKYVSAYKKFLEDWEAGLKGSNAVKAAEELFFTDEQINELRAKGMDVGEILANDFYKGIFSAEGKDRGAVFLGQLWDIFGGDIVSNGKLAASLSKTGDSINFVVEDVDALADALYNLTGLGFTPEFLESWLGALGMYSSDINMSASALMEMAAGFDAVSGSGAVNLEAYLQGLIGLFGDNTNAIWDYIDALLEAADKGDIEVDLGADSVQAARDKVRDALNEVAQGEENVTDQPATVEITETGYDNVVTKLDRLRQMAEEPVIQRVVIASQRVMTNAGGTSNSPGGLSIVNEKGPELIADGNTLRIAGQGKPTLTYLSQGAQVLTAEQTRGALGSVDPSLFYGGISMYATGKTKIGSGSGGTTINSMISSAVKAMQKTASTAKALVSASTAQSYSVPVSSTSASSYGAGGSSGGRSSGGGGGGSSSSSKSDATLDKLKEIVSLRKSELSLLQAKGATTKDQINKEREIQDALKNEINYLVSIGGNQEEINKLWTEWYKINDDIEKLIKNMLDELSKAADREIDALEKARDKALEPLDAQLEAMQAERDAAADQLEYEEKLLAVEEARQALANAMSDERKIRYWNAATGQWEHTYDAKTVASAQQAYDDAVKALADYEEQMAYDAKVAEIEAQKKAIEDAYDDAVGGWEEVIDALKEPTDSMETVLKRISESSMPEMESTINTLNALLARFGYAIGGYGGAYLNEMMVPTDITSAMIAPVSGSISGSLSSVAYGSTPNGFAGTGSTSIGTQYNGGVYNIGGISLTEEQARSTTVYELAMLSRNLKAYNATC